MGRKRASVDDVGFEDMKEVLDDPDLQAQVEKLTELTPPDIGAEGWTEYVMGKLRPGEIIDGAPKVDGLRRLAYELVGHITSTEVSVVQAPNPVNHYTATVLCRVEIYDNSLGSHITFQEVGDATPRNTPHPFNLHLSSTAASRAEGRALRRILRLNNVIAAEELAPENAQAAEAEEHATFQPEFITSLQITLLDKLCAENNVDAVKYLNSGKKKYPTVHEVSRQTAAEAIEYIHKYAQDTDKIPQAVRGYVKEWQNG